MNPVSAPAGTEATPVSAAIETWLASPTIRDDAAVLAYSYVLAWAIGKGEGLPSASPELACLVETVLRDRKTDVRESFRVASDALLTNLEQGGVGMWVPFETPIH
jgi:hypothetical protein